MDNIATDNTQTLINADAKIKDLEQQLAEYKARIEDLDDLVHMMLPFVETAKGDVHYRQDKCRKCHNVKPLSDRSGQYGPCKECMK